MYDENEHIYEEREIGGSAPVAYTIWKSGEKSAKPKKNRLAVKVAALALCCTMLGSAAGAVCMGIIGKNADKAEQTTTIIEGSRQNAVLNVSITDTGKLLTAAELYASNVNSTVGVTTSVQLNYFGYRTTSAASGSGFILTEDGYIATNYHVIEDASSVTVTTYGGESYDAVIVGYDESSDVAVLKIEAEGLTPVILGDSDKTNVGDDVIAIGNPLGELTFSLTGGYVSALGRSVTFSSGITMSLIQTDCAINSGNSGGALFNMYGEVIGITNAKYSGSGSDGEASIDNIGFAIPINSVRDIIKNIIETGYTGSNTESGSGASTQEWPNQMRPGYPYYR